MARLVGLGVVAEADGVDRLVDLDVPRLAVAGLGCRVARQDPQRGEAAGAQGEHGRVVEGVDGDEPLPLGGAEQRDPLLVARRVERGPREVGVGGVGVVHDEEPVGGGLDVVLDALAAGRHDAPLPLGVVAVEQVHLGRGLRAEAEHDPALVAAARDPHPEALVVLLVDEHVVGRVAADAVPPQLVRPPRVVEARVEEEPAVAAELDAVPDVGDGGVEDRAGRDLADREVEALVARGVDRERDEPVVGAHGQRAHREELVVPGLDVAVDDDLLARHGIRLGVGTHSRVDERGADVRGVLLPLDRAREVPPRAAHDGHRQVGLLDPRPDLLEQRRAQRREVLRARLGVGVLGLEVRDQRGVLEVAHPRVGVLDAVAVVLPDVGAALGGRRGGARHGVTVCRVPSPSSQVTAGSGRRPRVEVIRHRDRAPHHLGHRPGSAEHPRDAARAAPGWGAALAGPCFAGVRDPRRGPRVRTGPGWPRGRQRSSRGRRRSPPGWWPG